MNEEYDKVVTLLLDAKESLREARDLANEAGLHADFDEMITVLDIFTCNIQMDAARRGSEGDEQ
ncbi:MAG: hypothetical protein ACFN4K_05805 [Pauljensenia sp.]